MKKLNLIPKNAILLLIALFPAIDLHSQQDPFPLIDLHIHIKGDLTVEKAIQKSRAEHLQFGIAVNCGLGFPVLRSTDRPLGGSTPNRQGLGSGDAMVSEKPD